VELVVHSLGQQEQVVQQLVQLVVLTLVATVAQSPFKLVLVAQQQQVPAT
jgi:hypothetical protein